MSEFSFIYMFLIAFALCIASLFIVKIVNEKSTLNEEDVDMITKLIQNRTRMLEVNMPKVSIKAYLLMSALSPVIFGIIFWMIFPNKLFAMAMALFTVLLPDFIIRLIVESRKKRYEEKYVRALKSFSSGLKAGLSIQQSIEEVIRNPFVDEGIREGFRQINADIKVGISIEDAFFAFAEKADNNDARDVAAAIAMQAKVGGSEAKVIESIATNIEDRLMTKKKIRSIFASTDYMIKFFDILPFIAIVLMCVGMPDLVKPIMEDTFSMLVVIGLLVFSLIGSVVMRKRIRAAKGE